ncbi:MAG TPA: FtsW/RodA/SpoVE family cell cycle protein [Acidimicrobiales bacterium]|nr:FtsW/RodA/SpoVE family cell cycle protein [Acidimicrobiales bacterium]
MAAHLLDRGARVRSRRDERGAAALARHLDVVLIASTLVLAGLGLVVVYAATRSTYPFEPTYFLKRQIVFTFIGIGAMVAVASIDYRRLEQWAYVIFGGIVLALLAVFVIGRSSVTTGTGGTTSGVAQRWINLGPFQFQPSEFAVLGLIGALALYMSRHEADLGPKRLVPLAGIAAVPLLLVVKQPDLGTAIVMVVVSFTMVLVGGVKLRYIVGFALLGVVAFVAGIDLHLVHSTQLQRLTSFLHPNQGALGANYQADVAKNAIGAGGLKGAGLFKGLVTSLNYVPEQSTDFIFATVGEQLGFIGSAVVIGLYGVMALRMLRAVQAARDGLGRLLCTGALAFLVFSVYQNIGMNIGLMPITGIPLPFFSYGGSALIVFYASVGLVLNVEMRRHRIR